MSLSLLIFILIAIATLGSAAVALALKNIIRAALLLVVSWVGIAAFYLWADAQFVAFAQVLVYVGAISMVVLFGVVLTRRAPVSVVDTTVTPSMRAVAGVASAGLVALAVVWGILGTELPQTSSRAAAPVVNMRALGLELMGQYAAAILIVGALLTVALLGSVVVASHEEKLMKNEK
ncbi:NADH:ubiquinone oxidoreductase subunit 6 (subunit J) [Ereboglobus sp. PH5-10]|uniref:NADH-quinone oxidoreductase subunit J family protein n=1 Tax=Ereboglobus sp. PH5-10 TaxID=2940629 RepID=UPI0024057A6E|nr:NADH-quinone oxidoreductase subunit J [Ereboglobus sp. PH5-10]MDF9827738.1 NADH:ubiquinone oxidoreductase subunit 6 (subunit J) [Ereboglobus sp. PH5-10]